MSKINTTTSANQAEERMIFNAALMAMLKALGFGDTELAMKLYFEGYEKGKADGIEEAIRTMKGTQ